MPGGDGSGPMGMGPMTGRGMGPCANNANTPNPNNPEFAGRGFVRGGMGMGMGRGCGRGGRGGRGARNMYKATGLTRWQRGGMGGNF